MARRCQIPGRLSESVFFTQGGAFEPPDHYRKEFHNFKLRWEFF